MFQYFGGHTGAGIRHRHNHEIAGLALGIPPVAGRLQGLVCRPDGEGSTVGHCITGIDCEVE